MGNQWRLHSASDICSYFLIPVISRAAEFLVLCNFLIDFTSQWVSLTLGVGLKDGAY